MTQKHPCPFYKLLIISPLVHFIRPPPPLQLGEKEYYIKYNSKCTDSCYVFSFLHNFELKAEAIID